MQEIYLTIIDLLKLETETLVKDGDPLLIFLLKVLMNYKNQMLQFDIDHFIKSMEIGFNHYLIIFVMKKISIIFYGFMHQLKVLQIHQYFILVMIMLILLHLMFILMIQYFILFRNFKI